MPHRQLTTLQHMAAVALLLSSQLPRTVAAQELDAEDVPAECVPLCAPIVQLTARCEAQTTRRFGNLGRRWDGFPATHDVAERRRRRRRRKQESVRKRQGSGSESDSDSSDDEEAQPPRPALAAAKQANKVCVCEERGFDVAGVANVCAGCIARNGTAVDADEGDYRRVRIHDAACDCEHDVHVVDSAHELGGPLDGRGAGVDCPSADAGANQPIDTFVSDDVDAGFSRNIHGVGGCVGDGGWTNHARDGFRDARVQDLAANYFAE
ncbi:hypothetical protein C8034_v000618 [Colletotrichum sidae]|uniref:Uncharacterized protein n=1 Tax=Colletotrichum sidae TaxID=1347389 RepID=A0A4R8TFY9_9PEZI|nr:hypothetical protein C8034_v000618 [Colletotrichum sidae]